MSGGKFKPGPDERRNAGGRPKGRTQALEAFRVLIEERVKEKAEDGTVRDIHIDAIILAVKGGDSQIIKELMHYRWGKPDVHVSVGDESGEPLGIVVQFVRPEEKK